MRGINKFQKVFPDGMKINRVNYEIAMNNDLDVEWWLSCMYGGHYYEMYVSQASVIMDMYAHWFDQLNIDVNRFVYDDFAAPYRLSKKQEYRVLLWNIINLMLKEKTNEN